MINRINLILQAKNITARQFAEEIGIQPSGMSHILSGRNNPSLDFVMKVIRRYPEIDINWLMLGKGEMYETIKKPYNESVTTNSPVTATSTPVSVTDNKMEESSVPGKESLAYTQKSLLNQSQNVHISNNVSPVNAETPNVQPIAKRKQPAVKASSAEPDLFSLPQYNDSNMGNVTNNNVEPIENRAQNSVVNSNQHLPNNVSAPISEPKNQIAENRTFNDQLPTDYEYQNLSGQDKVSNTRLEPNQNVSSTCPYQQTTGGSQANETKKIVKMVVFYDDHTFAEYKPE